MIIVRSNPMNAWKLRVSQRNGFYERELKTRVGTIELLAPRTLDGNFSTEIGKISS